MKITLSGTVSFHNFKSPNFKLSVSNPKSKYVAYVSVLSQISNCQGLGRKNEHEVLKTDRMYDQCARNAWSVVLMYGFKHVVNGFDVFNVLTCVKL